MDLHRIDMPAKTQVRNLFKLLRIGWKCFRIELRSLPWPSSSYGKFLWCKIAILTPRIMQCHQSREGWTWEYTISLTQPSILKEEVAINLSKPLIQIPLHLHRPTFNNNLRLFDSQGVAPVKLAVNLHPNHEKSKHPSKLKTINHRKAMHKQNLAT